MIGMDGAAILFTMEFVRMEEVEEVGNPKLFFKIPTVKLKQSSLKGIKWSEKSLQTLTFAGSLHLMWSGGFFLVLQ